MAVSKTDYITLKEAEEKWNISARMICNYCMAGRIPGALKKGNMWLIPPASIKPEDKRALRRQNCRGNRDK